MQFRNKTKQDFEDHIVEKVNEYQMVKDDLGLDFAFYRDKQKSGLVYYLITNNHITTKILYNPEYNLIIENHIYNSDIIILNQLKDKIYLGRD